MPIRVQLRRVKGWRLPPNCVKVSRPGPFGNPFKFEPIDEDDPETWENLTRKQIVHLFRQWLEGVWPFHPQKREKLLELLPTLRGKDLACWCKLCDAHKDGKPFGVECTNCSPCHADVLLELANK